MKKKVLSLVLSLALCFTLVACGGAGGTEEETYLVGICQLAPHPALDAATKGFRDALTEALGDRVTFEEQNAAGDSATCAIIANQFVTDGVDLIMANATGALQAAAAATADIPILGTSISAYGVALNLDDFSGTVGGNVSGTSDLAPLDRQAALFPELLPEAKSVGILYCAGEANSVYQAEIVAEELTKLGITVKEFTFADSNEVAAVTQSACDACDALFIPTDNTAADCAEAINNVALTAKTPIITGEEAVCAACGIATLTIDYYELGRVTGEMAAGVLTGETDIATLAVAYYPDPVKKYNAELCETYGVTVPDDFTVIA